MPGGRVSLVCPHCGKDVPLEGDDGSIGAKARKALGTKIDSGELGVKDLHTLVMKDLEVEQDRIKAQAPRGEGNERTRRAGRALGTHRGRFSRQAYETPS